jgi:hypothetical protein
MPDKKGVFDEDVDHYDLYLKGKLSRKVQRLAKRKGYADAVYYITDILELHMEDLR